MTSISMARELRRITKSILLVLVSGSRKLEGTQMHAKISFLGLLKLSLTLSLTSNP